MGLYITGYIITFLILFFCRKRYFKPPLIDYLHRMGIITPFHCAQGNFSSAMIQALIWPWPFVVLALMLVLFPLAIIYILLKK